MRSLLAVLVLLGLVVAPALSQDATDYMITPGYAIGGISIGMDLNLVFTVLGTPTTSRSAGGPFVLPVPNGAREYEWPTGLTIMVVNKTTYAVEMMENAHYFLPNELHVGVTGATVRTAMGGSPPRIVSTPAWTGWAYDDKGVAFYFHTDHSRVDEAAVFRIDVYKPRATY